MTYEQRVAELEAEGLTTSDAQAVIESEELKARHRRTNTHESITLASRGRSRAEAHFHRDDEGWWYGIDLHYSYGGFVFPISHGPFESKQQAQTEAIEHMLRSFHRPFPSDPESVKTELADLRCQVEGHLLQPSLF